MTDPQILLDYEAHGLAIAERPGILDDLREALDANRSACIRAPMSPTTRRATVRSARSRGASGLPMPPSSPSWAASPSLTTSLSATASLRSLPAPAIAKR